MRWEDERYVRLYTRDTADWLSLSFEAQGLMTLILRKADRAGILSLGRHGKRAVAIAIGHAGRWEAVAPALEELLADGCIRIEGDKLLLPNFIEAQEAAQSDAQRQRESRAKARALAAAGVTKRDGMSHAVTDGHNTSQPVTPSRAVPSVPSRAEPPVAGNPVAAMSALVIQAVSQGAEPGRRVEDAPANANNTLEDKICRLWEQKRGKPPARGWFVEAAARAAWDKAEGDERELLRVLAAGLDMPFPLLTRLWDLVKNYDTYAATKLPEGRPKNGRATEAEKDWSGFAPSDDSDEIFEGVAR